MRPRPPLDGLSREVRLMTFFRPPDIKKVGRAEPEGLRREGREGDERNEEICDFPRGNLCVGRTYELGSFLPPDTLVGWGGVGRECFARRVRNELFITSLDGGILTTRETHCACTLGGGCCSNLIAGRWLQC